MHGRTFVGWWTGLGVLLFWSALMGTGDMMWRAQCVEGVQLAQRDGAVAEPEALVAEYRRTHGRDFRRLVLGLPLLLSGCMVVFFAPSLIAAERDHPRAESIFMVNTFCGVTVVGWLVALAMALRRSGEPASRRAR